MRINHNISALNTYRQLTANNSATSSSLQKLSSGLRINSAADDAAGLAISEKMRGQIRGLDQASNNANDGISLIQTAEGGLNETHSILQRMRELAVQSANDTNTDADRAEIQKEIEQLTQEITRISNDTQFNTKNLLDGTMAATATATGAPAGVTTEVAAGSILEAGTYNVSLTYSKDGAEAIEAAGEVDAAASVVDKDVNDGGGDFSVTGDYTGTYTGTATFDGTNWVDGSSNTVALSGLTVSNEGSGSKVQLTAHKDAVAAQAAVDKGFTATITDGDGNEVSSTALKFTAAEGTADITAAQTFTVGVNTTNAMTFHIGANEGQNTKLTVQNMSATALGISEIDLTSQSGADKAITTIDAAISTVSAQRAGLGAMQNRLEHTINNLSTTSENLSASESQIRDVDMAKEMMEYTKNNILSQAAQSMLAQANQQPQNVLQLLQ